MSIDISALIPRTPDFLPRLQYHFLIHKYSTEFLLPLGLSLSSSTTPLRSVND
jgi:hypothetical protein